MELNRERIIRGLECCKGSYDCFTCDIYKRGCAGFREGLARDALSLIKELTEENERLAKHNAVLIEDNHILATEFKGITIADTVRKMHSEIEKRCIKGGIYPAFVKSTIDQIAKEIIGGSYGKKD